LRPFLKSDKKNTMDHERLFTCKKTWAIRVMSDSVQGTKNHIIRRLEHTNRVTTGGSWRIG
jgi:hypothetical protein